MKLDISKIRPRFSKTDPKVLDPPRFPKVITPNENEMKRSFADLSNQTVIDLTKMMVEFKK